MSGRKFPQAVHLLAGDPSADEHAARKRYVDDQVATKQPLDSDLTTIAGLTATTDNMIQSVSSAWASRTPAQVKTALAIAASDVGSGVFSAARIPLVLNAPQTLTYAATLNIDAATGNHWRVTATGNPTLAVPTNGADGQQVMVEVLASAAQRTVTLHASIIMTASQAGPLVIASGKVGFILLRFSALASNVWVCLALDQTV